MRKATDVIPHLGAPHHFQDDRSAKLIAETWFGPNDLPVVVRHVLDQSPRLRNAELVDAFLERCIELGDGLRPSQTDVLAIIALRDELAVIAVEGKVDESFGPRVSEWLEGGSAQKRARLERLAGTLGLDSTKCGTLRYQLLHRTASAVYEAHRYRARVAAMIVHSFDPGGTGTEDFNRFVETMSVSSLPPSLLTGPVTCEGVELYLGWASDHPSALMTGLGTFVVPARLEIAC